MKRLALIAPLALAACPKGGDKPKPVEPAGRGDAQTARLLPETDGGAVSLPPAPPVPVVPAGLPPPPPANPRITAEAVALGALVFADARLSARGDRSCASCHVPAAGYAGGNDTAADGKQNLRRTPSLVNLAWVRELGWDGRYPTLADHLPPHVRGQLGEAIETASERLAADPTIRAHVERVGGTPAAAVQHGLEAFVLTRYEGGAPWDELERTALAKPGAAADPVVAGYQVFMGKGRCGVCHPPPLYTDGGYHRVEPNVYDDPGRGRVDPARPAAFRTPTLRGAALRPAFFHTGAKKTLDEVVRHYAAAAADARPLDPSVREIAITADETSHLIAFVKALTADRR